MTFDNTQAHAADELSLTELDLYHLIMDYRATKGLAPIPLSENLTTTAGRHAADSLYNIWEAGLTLPEGANLHSWSDAFYYSDHRSPEVIWEAPSRIGTDYPGYGFEISAAGYGDIASALTGWQGSTGHDQVIVNEGVWASQTWNAIGIGVEFDASVGTYGGRIYHVWFGREADPDGAGTIAGGAEADTVKGTAFDDVIRGAAGADTLTGEGGNDRLRGDAGDDTLGGGQGRDKLDGGTGRDVLSGHGGRDRIDGGKGNDILKGGGKSDLFVFDDANWGRDKIRDYNGDRVKISAPGEAADLVELAAAITDRNGSAVYDHGGDGKNVIVFQGVTEAELNFALFDLG